MFPLLALFTLLAGLSDRLVLDEEILPMWFYALRSAALLLPAFSRQAGVHAAVIVFTLAAPVVFVAFAKG